jgi:transposase
LRLYFAYRAHQAGARRRELEHTLSWDRFVLLKTQERCPCCGKAFNLTAQADLVSIDRLDSTRGYSDGNCHGICFRCNAIKQDATSAEIRRVADWIDEVSRVG